MDNVIASIPLHEVGRLVHELYKPIPPETFNRIQEILLAIQKSPRGWEVAQALTGQPDADVKFYGALTFTVKLNTEKLSDEDATTLLHQLIVFLISHIIDGTPSFVLKKLCGTLVTYFLHYMHLWPKCIPHLSYCLQRRSSLPLDIVDNDSPAAFQESVQSLDSESYYAITWFVSFLGHEIEKIDQKSVKWKSFRDWFNQRLGDIVLLVGHGLDPSNPRNSRIKDSLDCLQPWLKYTGRNEARMPILEQFHTLVDPIINLLPNDETYDPTIELLTTLLEDWPTFFKKEHYESLYVVFESAWGQEKYRVLIESDDMEDESVRYGSFMLAFGLSEIVAIHNASDERAQRFLTSLVGLLRAKGYPGVDDRIFVPALEFWSNIAQFLPDSPDFSPENPQWDKPPLWQVMQAASEGSQKIKYPHISVYNSWDSSEKLAFGEARKDVGDFLEMVYSLVGSPLLSIFADKLLEALSRSAWAELEAAAFCFCSLSDCAWRNESNDEIMTKVFGSPLFDTLLVGQNLVPVRARQTCLNMIDRYSHYFQVHSEYLPAALNLLFSSMSDRHLVASSSKSIYGLCSFCRKLLPSELDTFLEQYGSLRGNCVDSSAEERVAGAIAAIIQAVPDQDRKTSASQKLLSMIVTDVEISLQLSSQPEGVLIPTDNPAAIRAFDAQTRREMESFPASEVSLQLALRALRCLSSMAKGLEADTIDVDSDTEAEADTDNDNNQAPINSALNQMQLDIMNILARIKDTFSNSSEVVEVISSIIRAGFSETDPGPFVFPPLMLTEFTTGRWHKNASTMVNLASAFVTSVLYSNQRKYIGEVVNKLIPWVIDLLDQLSAPEEEPELAQYGVELAQRIMVRCPEIFMAQPANLLEFLFMFALKVLNGNEPLPKQAAADFWATFLTLKTEDESVRAIINNATVYLGPKLSEALIHNFGGKAARSELNKLCDPLKKLITQHVNARQWLQDALQGPSFPSELVTAEDKELFLKKIIMLRGQRPTNSTVNQFWARCRGIALNYTD
ncbi:ARM repeat-containing protein [Hypoxylon trugodes]|uniref:ARM repeat-containing protein n=1 Tax=Hypoxylon trugodes TaxID=326681 RepID=UPI002196DD99|nr:ARM repeat-containing protein [Hypoxylon trugodes]KAI1384480.1 ARM repeat-containing protein [Hypoxylon trugodes]